MTKTEVLALLKKHRDERGIANWKKGKSPANQLTSFGIGLTRLRKLAKQIGRDHKLALQLWKTRVYDAKIIGLLIDDPRQMTREQAESQVEEVDAGNLAHVFASCSATLAKTPFVFELACDWMASGDPVRRRCGYTLVYELSRKNIEGMDDEWYLERMLHIQETIQEEEMWVKEAMKGALIGIGKRNRKLNQAAIRTVKAMGKVDVDYGDNNCQPVDVLKHLTSDYIKSKLLRAK